MPHINVYKYLKGGCKEGGARLFSEVCEHRTRGSGHKLEQGTFPLNIRKHFFHCECEHCHTLPRKIMESPSLEIFKDMVLGNLL